jgi:hypothetical protein
MGAAARQLTAARFGLDRLLTDIVELYHDLPTG